MVIKMLEKKAMEIILHAGDARLELNNVLQFLAEEQFEKCELSLDNAEKMLIKAHSLHTEVLQQVASGAIEENYSILFTHAQDTLMTVYSEFNLIKHLLEITRKITLRLSKLETK